MTALARLDHLVYATSDLEKTVEELDVRVGVRAAPGGQHHGRGTRNALISLSPSTYLEIIGPDPTQGPVASPRWFGIDSLPAPRLIAWAAKASNLELLSQRAAVGGALLGPVGEGCRLRADGTLLTWKFTDPVVVTGGGIVPFLIDWRTSAHPAESAPGGLTLVHLRAEHPVPSEIQRILAALEIDLPLFEGPVARLIATLDTPRGEVRLE
jgi:Glyoxalase-like domain